MTNLAGIAQARAPGCFPSRRRGIESAPRSTIVDRLSWQLGHDDAFQGKPWRVTPAEILARTFDGDRDVLSYLVGHRAGELDRARGGAHAL